MNTVTRAYGKYYAARPISRLSCSARESMCLGFCLCALLAAALAVIYVADLNRRLLVEYAQLQSQEQAYRVEQEQLLLEKHAGDAQAKVQEVAARRLSMVMPSAQDTVFIAQGSGRVLSTP